jgi:hypothetical protein
VRTFHLSFLPNVGTIGKIASFLSRAIPLMLSTCLLIFVPSRMVQQWHCTFACSREAARVDQPSTCESDISVFSKLAKLAKYLNTLMLFAAEFL